MRWNPRRLFPDPDARDRFEEPGAGVVGLLARVGVPAIAALRTAGFWAAVVLPLAYLPLLLSGLSTGRDAVLLVTLIALHLVALAAGHAHNRS